MNPTPTPLLQLHKSRLVYPNTADNVLGRGGFGAVFKAYDTVTQEMVAVKRVEIAAEDGKKGSVSANAMAKEYKAILNLPHHRNVISVHAVLEKENERLIVMELMPDGNLAQLMKKQEFSRARICQIAIQVANGLFALHKGSNGSNGSEPEHIFHRDLKPENILVDLSRNLFKICDFGLSTTTTSSVVYQTSTCGTYNYMAPEQFELRGSITDKTDIYGLGVIMWQMLTRKLPHEKLTVAEICRQVASSQQPLPYAVSETDNLSILIHRCTNSKPDQRPTLGDVVHELQRILELEHTPSENAPEATVPNIASASNSVDVDACNDGSALTSFGKLTSNPASS